MKKIRLGMIGGGPGAFFGDAHRRAARFSGHYELVGGVFSRKFDKSLAFALEEGLTPERIYLDVKAFVVGEKALSPEKRIQAVTVVTPNAFHFKACRLLLENGFHVICDKPVTLTIEEACQLKELVEKTGLTFCVTHTYTGYPMVRQMREMIGKGILGEIFRVDAQYYQGWVNAAFHDGVDPESIWRLDPSMAGVSSCIGDIGVHAFQLAEYVTGDQITHVLADLNKVKDNMALDLDATVLIRTKGGARGVIRSSQVATGEENALTLAIYGEQGSLKWEQENPNYLYYTPVGKPIQVFKPGNDYNGQAAKASHVMPCGHPEGIYEALANLYTGVAHQIEGKSLHGAPFPNVEDGVRGMTFIHRVIASDKGGNVWMTL